MKRKGRRKDNQVQAATSARPVATRQLTLAESHQLTKAWEVTDPRAWWAESKGWFLTLAKLAMKYLSAPPESAPSERLSSSAGDIYDEKRNRLVPDRAEMLLLIKNNFPLIGGDYN